MKQEWIYSYRLSDRIILGLSSRYTKAKYFWVQPNQNKFFDYISFIADCRPLACDHLNLGLELRIYTIQCNRNSNFLNQGLYDCYQKMNDPYLSPLVLDQQIAYFILIWSCQVMNLARREKKIKKEQHPGILPPEVG